MSSVPRKISSYKMLEKLGRVRLSDNFFMRDFLYSSIGDYYGVSNYPEDPKLAVEAGSRLCQELLEPLKAKFGHVTIRSAYRSPSVNQFGNKKGHECGSNEYNRAHHIWDQRDGDGNLGATACIVIPWFADQYEAGKSWQALAWWIHDHLPYNSQYYFPKRAAFNLNWRENPERWIKSYVNPKGVLTNSKMENWGGSHSDYYSWMDEEL